MPNRQAMAKSIRQKMNTKHGDREYSITSQPWCGKTDKM